MITRLLYLGWTALSVLISLFTGNWLWYLHAGHSTSSFEGICIPSSSLFTKLTLWMQFTVSNYLYGGHKVISRMQIQSQDPDTTMLCVSVHSIREFQSLCVSSCYQFLQKHRKPAWTYISESPSLSRHDWVLPHHVHYRWGFFLIMICDIGIVL